MRRSMGVVGVVVMVAAFGVWAVPGASALPGEPPCGGCATTQDYNDDGFADLAIGIPDESIGSVTQAGAVEVLYGSANGLGSAESKLWSQNSAGIGETSEPVDEFGSALATGDLNDDGFTDLAIGAPFESVGTVTSAGVVHV